MTFEYTYEELRTEIEDDTTWNILRFDHGKMHM